MRTPPVITIVTLAAVAFAEPLINSEVDVHKNVFHFLRSVASRSPAVKSDATGLTCPEGLVICGDDESRSGYCAEICCESDKEKCYDENGEPYCINISASTQGCPCPDGEVRCGISESSSGYCTKACCDKETEEVCYDKLNSPSSCAKSSEGGCKCPEGEEKCRAFESFPGYCTPVCCDWEEETCYDENFEPVSCVAYGECPENTMPLTAFDKLPDPKTTYYV